MSADLNPEYVRQLEDAALTLWQHLDMEETKYLRTELPRLMDFMAHLHHSIEHERWMVRKNVWLEAPDDAAQPGASDGTEGGGSDG